MALQGFSPKFFHLPDVVAYATADLGGHWETLPLRSQAFRRWMALFDGKERPVFTRLGERKASFYLDLGNQGGK